MRETTIDVDAIRNATTLDALCAALNDAQLTLSDSGSRRKLDELVDLTSLPSFGGEAPADTLEVFSWDATRELTFSDRWSVSTRDGASSPHLNDSATGEFIRYATAAELAESIAAAELDGGSGVISVDGRWVFATD